MITIPRSSSAYLWIAAISAINLISCARISDKRSSLFLADAGKVSLTLESEGGYTHLTMINRSSKIIKINKNFFVGYPDSSVTFKSIDQGRASSNHKEVKSTDIMNPANNKINIYPESFFGVIYRNSDIVEIIGSNSDCVEFSATYSSGKLNDDYDSFEVTSNKLSVCKE